MEAQSQNQYWNIKDYYVESQEYCKGENATFHKARKSNPNIEYICKIYSSPDSAKISQISEEIKNAKKENNGNPIIHLEDDFYESQSQNYFLFYLFFNSISLEDLLSKNDFQQNTQLKLIIASQLANAIFKLHGSKLMHRNINPKHILISQDLKSLKLCGHSSIFNFSENKSPIDIIGVPPFRAPEIKKLQNGSIKYNEQVDIYSFGIVLFRLFTGKNPEGPLSLIKIKAAQGIPLKIKELILKCYNLQPYERFNSTEIIRAQYYIYDTESMEKSIPEKKSPSNSPQNPSPNKINPLLPENSNDMIKLQNDSHKIDVRDNFDPYRKEAKIDEGGFSDIYKVINITTNEILALKEIKMKQLDSDKAFQLIYGEIENLENLKDVDLVIKIKDKFHHKGNNQLCLVLEYCNGGNLTNYVKELKKKNKKMSIAEIKFFSYSIAQGFKELHKRNIVHRDVKADNILLIKNESGQVIQVKICDLGLSKKVQDSSIEKNRFLTCVGSGCYIAPEMREMNQEENLPLTEKVDVFSFGILLIFLIFGQNADILQNNKPKFYKGFVEIPEIKAFPQALVDLVEYCLTRNPSSRPSFDDILKQPFFTNTQIKLFPVTQINLNLIFKARESQNSVGFVSQDKQLWIKLFRYEKNNSEFNIKLQKEIDILVSYKDYIEKMVPLYSFGYIDDYFAFAFPYLNGRSLEDLYKYRKNDSQLLNGPFFSISEIKCVARGLIQFINKFHSHNMLHKNLIPKHILLVIGQNGYIGDIRVSGFNSPISFKNLSHPGCYSNDYAFFMDPFLSHENYFYNEGSDLWSIGMIIFFMCFGCNFDQSSQNFLYFRQSGNITFPISLDENIKKFILFCIKKRNPDDFSKVDVYQEYSSEKIQL